LFSIAAITFVYWAFVDAAKILPAVSSVLIVACPCSLLLSATFTYGNILRLFGKNKMYLKNAAVIETMAGINTVVFDKTGTITHNNTSQVNYEGAPLSLHEMQLIKTAVKQSSHPLSKSIAREFQVQPGAKPLVTIFKEYAGKGLYAVADNVKIKMGSASFINADKSVFELQDTNTAVHVMLNDVYKGRFIISNQYREGVTELVTSLHNKGYRLYLLSGDNEMEKETLSKIFGSSTSLHFNQSPQQKLDFINALQQNGQKVLMAGDGLNDAGALMQANAGVAVSDNTAQFSPASDAILDGSKVFLLDKFLAFARSGKKIVTASFVLSILYNIVGLSFAVQGILSPVVAAVLMPASSISIVLLVTLLSSISARFKNL
jgi:Cu+-exporting ATPase